MLVEGRRRGDRMGEEEGALFWTSSVWRWGCIFGAGFGRVVAKTV